MRPPRFAGLTDGVGTSTLARALHGVDTGRYAGGPVDVLVCGVGSLATAVRFGGPVLAVVAERAPRLDRLGCGFGAVVAVPEIAAWRQLDAPDVAGLLGMAPQRRPARLQPYIDALLEITAGLLGSGALDRPAPRSAAPGGPPRPVADGRRRAAVVTPTRRGPATTTPTADAARTAVARIAAARVVPAPVVRTPVVPTPVVPAPVVLTPVVLTPVVPAPVVPAPVVPAPVVPAPVVPGPSLRGPAVPTAARATPAGAGTPTVTAPPLWRGLQAVERMPPGGAGLPAVRGGAGLDDDAVESAGVG